MGLFRRKKGDEPPHRLPGYAALARDDIGDARRRRPDVDLSGYAAERGLDFLGSRNAAGYFAALPLDEQLQFNVMRGELAGGRDGCLFHWVRAWPTSTSGDPGVGTFYVKVWNPPLPKGWWKPDASFLPYVGWIVDLFRNETVDYECAIGIPFTVAATNVPEAAALPDFSIDNRPRPLKVGGHREKLGDRGLPGFDLVAAVEPPRAVVDRLLAGPLRDVIAAGRNAAMLEIKLLHGTLSIRRNGYAKEPEQLDQLMRLASVAGDALRDACRPELAPRPFEEPLPAVDWPASGVSLSGRFPPSPWLEALHALAGQLGMTLEDPAAFHRAFGGSAPVPGRPFAVLRGALPGTATVGRLVFCQERALTQNDGRTALLLPAAPGAAETPPWGVRLEEPRISYAVRDGIFSAWVLRSSGTLGDFGDLPGLMTTALQLGVEQGLVQARAAGAGEPV